MAKMNYTKIEDSFDEGLHKMKVKKLWEMADTKRPKQLSQELEKTHKNRQLLLAVSLGLKFLQRIGQNPYERLQISLSDLKKMEENNILNDEDISRLEFLKTKIDLAIKQNQAATFDEKSIEKERRHQCDKRFNIQDHWLQL